MGAYVTCLEILAAYYPEVFWQKINIVGLAALHRIAKIVDGLFVNCQVPQCFMPVT